ARKIARYENFFKGHQLPATPGNNLAKVGVEGSNPFARSKGLECPSGDVSSSEGTKVENTKNYSYSRRAIGTPTAFRSVRRTAAPAGRATKRPTKRPTAGSEWRRIRRRPLPVLNTRSTKISG